MLFSSASIKGVSILSFGKSNKETSSSTSYGIDNNEPKESREDDVEDDVKDDENSKNYYEDCVAANTLLELQNQYLKSKVSSGLNTKVETLEKKKAQSRQTEERKCSNVSTVNSVLC
eukprot:4626861-Ditylum_brightwellii.AAC.1